MEGLLSPPASAASPSPSLGIASTGSTVLPTPRKHPLRPGSEKEIALINYLDTKMLRISRRYGKKFTDSDAGQDDAPGYTNMDQVVADVDLLVDVAYISGTPHLQTSYLLSLAGAICSYIPAFAFSTSIFRLLNKLDLAFATLLQPASGQSTNGSGASLSITDRVRIKSMVEESRVVAVNSASTAGYPITTRDLSSDDDSGSEVEGETPAAGDDMLSQGDESTGIALSNIYKRTLEILGDALA